MRTKTNLRLLRPATFGGRARNGKALIFLLGLLTLLLCFSNVAYGVMLDKPGNDEKQFNEENTIIPGQQKDGQVPEYAPGEVIIKLKAKEEPERLYAQAYSERTAKDASVLSRLKNEYSLKDEKPVFEALHNQLKAKNLSLQQLQVQTESKTLQKTKKAQIDKKIDLFPIYRLGTGQEDVLNTCARLNKDPDVEYAEPNYIVEAQMVPNDPYYASQGSWQQSYEDLWGLHKLECEPAWDVSQGDGGVVAVVDTGVDYNHPDLAANIWHNPGEIPGNNIDDDGNGYVDDWRGWDFANNDNDPSDFYGHGSHVAGTIAAVANNNIGVIGVAPRAKIMIVKGLNDLGSGYASVLAEALYYAADNGADVTNNSWGRQGSSSLLKDTFDNIYAQGVLSIAAAGNSGKDAAGYIPASYESVIAVAATTQNDEKTYFSNYGEVVDVAAPGGGYNDEPNYGLYNILSAVSDLSVVATKGSGVLKISNGYYRLAGTSMAAPHVAGIAALVIANDPTLSLDDVWTQIINGVDPFPNPPSQPIGAGRVNARLALTAPYVHNRPPLIESLPDEKMFPEYGITLTVSATDIDGDHLTYRVEDIPEGSCFDPATRTFFWQPTASQEGTYYPAFYVSDGQLERYMRVKIDVVPRIFDRYAIDPLGGTAAGIDAADIDKDGDVDIAVTNHGSNDVYWFENNNYLAFTRHIISDSVLAQPWSISCVDLDNDGKVDILNTFRSGDSVVWHENDGNQKFTMRVAANANSPNNAYALDMDRDEDKDILLARLRTPNINGGIEWYENNGSQSFSKHVILEEIDGLSCMDVAAVDIGKDGDMDIIGAYNIYHSDDGSFSNYLVWYENDGDQNFIEYIIADIEADSIEDIEVDDLDGDGDYDIVTAATIEHVVSWYENDGAQNFTKHMIAETSAYARVVRVGDIDGDGDKDIVSGTAFGDNEIIWHENDGTGNFDNHIIHTASGEFLGLLDGLMSLDVTDIDNDGDLDIPFTLIFGVAVNYLRTNIPCLLPSVWDIDDNGEVDANTDGMLVFRYLVGFTGSSLTDGALGVGAQRANPEAIAIYLTDLQTAGTVSYLDANGDGSEDGLSDGVIIYRFMDKWWFGNALTNETVSAGCTRQSPDDIISFLLSAQSLCPLLPLGWDIDDNGEVDANTDGMLVFRYLVGFTGSSLTDGALGVGANRTNPNEIASYLDSVKAAGFLDADGNGVTDALTDGVLIMRVMKRWFGNTLINGAVAGDATRTTANEIIDFLVTLNLPVGTISGPPILDYIGDKEIDEGQVLSFPVVATDATGDLLNYSADPLPKWSNFTGQTFTWTPDYHQAGIYGVIFTVSDDGGLADSETITITVNNVNRPPVLDPIGNKTTAEGKILEFKVTASDPDGDILAYSAEGLPQGAAFANQVFTWTPDYKQAGTYDIKFTVSDDNLSASESIVITVINVNRPPVLNPIGNKTGQTGKELSFYVTAIDLDGDRIIMSAIGLPLGAKFEPAYTIPPASGTATYIFRWVPYDNQAGDHRVTFIASDGSDKASETIVITIKKPARPIINAIKPSFGAPGSSIGVYGKGFGAINNSSHIYFYYYGTNKIAGEAAIAIWTDTYIKCTVPNLKAGRYNVRAATSSGLSNGVNFTVMLPTKPSAPSAGTTTILSRPTIKR